MVRPGKLKTRRSTLGTTRNERIVSAMNSHSASIYNNSSSRKTENNSRKRGGRIGGYTNNEQRDEYVPSSITMESKGYARSPKLDYATSCSITTRSSLQQKQKQQQQKQQQQQQRNQSPSKLKRSLSLRKQSSREPPSPSNVRRSLSFGRQSSRDQSEANILRQSSSRQSSRNQSPARNMRQSAGGQSPARILRRSSSRQSAGGQSPARNLRQSSSRQSAGGQSPARNLRQSSSRQSSGGQSPAKSLRQSSSRQSSRDPSQTDLRQPLSKQSSRVSRQSPSRQSTRDQSPNLNTQYSRNSRQSESRQSSQAASRSRSRPNSVTPSIKSSVLSSTTNASNDNYEEKIELVAMLNEQNQSFVRILVSKTSYKPNMGDGVEVIPDSEVSRSQAARVTHRRGKGIIRRNSFKRRQTGEDQKTTGNDHVDDGRTNQEQRTEENDQVSPDADERNDETIDAPKEELMPPILDAVDFPNCDNVNLAMTAINAITACSSPTEGSFQVESNTATSSRRTKSTAFEDPNKVIRLPLPDDENIEDGRDGVNGANYYGIHSLKKSSSRRKLFSFKSEDSADRAAKKEKAKEEKKQKKIQKRLDKEAKKQIKKELLKQEQINRELYNQKQEQMRRELHREEQMKRELYKQKQEQLRREQYKQEQMNKELYKQEQMKKKILEKNMRRSNSFNSAAIKKINYVTRSRSDDRIYEKSYQDTFPRVAAKQPWEETYPQIVPNKSSGSDRSGIFQKLRASFSMDQEAGIPVRTVSFVSEGELEDRNYGYGGKQEQSYRSGASSRGTEAMQGTIQDMGDVFACGAMTQQDMRDMRMVDSDISSSEDEDDSSGSSSGYHYYTSIR